MGNIYAERISELRRLMKDNDIDSFLITKFDPHQSEYAAEYWNMVKFFSGFTGSAGTVVITQTEACFWTDGRYVLQSRNQLAGSEYKIFITTDFGCPDFADYICDNTKSGGKLSFDERALSYKKALEILGKAEKKNISYVSGAYILDSIYGERKSKDTIKAFDHDIKYCGISREEKLKTIREKMAEKNSGFYIISGLEDIAWLLNLRAKVMFTPVFESYILLTQDEAFVFAAEGVLDDVTDVLAKADVNVCDYDNFYTFLRGRVHKGGSVMFAPDRTCYALYSAMEKCKKTELPHDITTELKAVKNPVEIENTKKTGIIDGVSLVKFIKWLKEEGKNANITEYEAANKLENIRARDESFINVCFSTICGYGPNGAVIHYRAHEDTALVIKPEGFLLMDSGGSYLGGTTDITRTVVFGPVTQEMKDDFTLVLKGHIALAQALFLEGTNGHYIDILARKPLWDNLKDYKHGTGHGIGFALGVHEGPQRIAAQPSNTALKPGMLISNEPGFYKENCYGIRCENILLVKEYQPGEYGKFLNFETVSYAPFDLEAVNVSLLDDKEINWLNNYHDMVYELLSPHLDEREKEWLRGETRHI